MDQLIDLRDQLTDINNTLRNIDQTVIDTKRTTAQGKISIDEAEKVLDKIYEQLGVKLIVIRFSFTSKLSKF